jgi:hypothetical protein
MKRRRVWTCAELIDYDKQFETESTYCGVYGEVYRSYCRPPVTSAPARMSVDGTTVAIQVHVSEMSGLAC